MPMIRTVSRPVGSSTRIVSPSTTSTTVPARGAGVGVGASVGAGARVGDGVGATDGDGETEGDAAGVGDDVAAVTAATSWSAPPPTAAATTMTAPAASRPIFLRDTRLWTSGVMACPRLVPQADRSCSASRSGAAEPMATRGRSAWRSTARSVQRRTRVQRDGPVSVGGSSGRIHATADRGGTPVGQMRF